MSALVSTDSPAREQANRQLAYRIHRQLAADCRAVARLQIEVEDDVVTLRGTATSFYQKQLWLHGTKRVIGPDALINDEIAVAPSWAETDFGWRE